MSMRSLRSRRPVIAALGLLAATVAGCSSQPATLSSSAPHVDAVAAVVFRSSPSYAADGRALYLARQELIGRCMTRRGFAYHASPLLPEPAAGRPSSAEGYGLYRAFAALSGAARAAVRAAGTPSAQPQARYLRRLAPARRAAYDRAMDGSSRATGFVEAPRGGRGHVPHGRLLRAGDRAPARQPAPVLLAAHEAERGRPDGRRATLRRCDAAARARRLAAVHGGAGAALPLA